MKDKVISILVSAVLLSSILLPALACAGDLDKPYSPTKKEWLEMSIFKAIKIRTDAWEQRIGFMVWVKEEEKTVYITLTSANGEKPLKQSSREGYVKTVKGDIEHLLSTYEWSKHLKVFVQFV